MNADLLSDRPVTALAQAAVNDAMAALRKATNNHPVLERNSPHRRDFVRYLTKCVEREGSMSLFVNATVCRKGVLQGHEVAEGGYRVVLHFTEHAYRSVEVLPELVRTEG